MNFGLSNNMQVVGHTLVWHSQVPNWVFAGTNPAPTNGTAVAANTNSTATNRFGRGGLGGGFGGGLGRYNGARAFLKHRDSVKMVTFWGVNDANSRRVQGKPLLFDGNSQPKAAFDAVIADAKKAAGAK